MSCSSLIAIYLPTTVKENFEKIHSAGADELSERRKNFTVIHHNK